MREARLFIAFVAIATVSAGPPGPASAQTEAETLGVVSDIVRDQGLACTDPSAVRRDDAASKPLEPVYVLTCKEGTYTVQVIPDQAAKITKGN
jgi:hypothetical protein